jgi:hypothetical protein
MTNLRLGFKIYDNDWFLKYALTPDQAADRLAGLGATYVIAQSRFLPMQDSAVESQVREAEGATRLWTILHSAMLSGSVGLPTSGA